MPNEKGQFQPGEGGRPKGSQNQLTKTVKETVLAVFNEIQEDPELKLSAFAKKHPRDFYQIAAKLIPTEIQAKFSKIKLEIVRTNKTEAEQPSSDTGEGTE